MTALECACGWKGTLNLSVMLTKASATRSGVRVWSLTLQLRISQPVPNVPQTYHNTMESARILLIFRSLSKWNDCSRWWGSTSLIRRCPCPPVFHWQYQSSCIGEMWPCFLCLGWLWYVVTFSYYYAMQCMFSNLANWLAIIPFSNV